MELGIRDWMILVGILLIFAVLLDGYRRLRNERRGKIRMALNKQFLNSGVVEDSVVGELPVGEVRIVERRSWVDSKSKRAGEAQADLALDQSVPMLMESVSAHADESALFQPQHAFTAHPETALPEELDPLFDDVPLDHAVAPAELPDEKESLQEVAAVDEQPDPADDAPAVESPAADAIARADTRSQAVTKLPQEVLVVNVMARRGEQFAGPDLLHILLACDLRFGDMNIFHRYEGNDGRGARQFSLANILEPGTFDLDAINDFRTAGVCLFMDASEPLDPMRAFDYMVETAQCLAKNLHGELLDDSRSVMTAQTLEHCRQRIRDFERRRLALQH